ncbi:hypothetical protein Psuf_059990 [Phytohabitans suffuscus]|uniref:Uncharacterized protein n=1 Tax=Phytohabitans suffuscus TaxID=624315 RepID=A0A6F8YRK2_9ACTN|nr:hypothetical protein Psuf_059990 [Phytohabitans suffuscus]
MLSLGMLVWAEPASTGRFSPAAVAAFAGMIVVPLLVLSRTAFVGDAGNPDATASVAASGAVSPSVATSPTARASTGQDELRQAVVAYSDAYLVRWICRKNTNDSPVSTKHGSVGAGG